MRLFGGDRMDKISDMMVKTGMPDDQPIQAKMVTKAVESAQRKVEEVNFAMRKNVLDYDNVMNTQRQVIYEERNKILDGKDLMAHIDEVTYDTVQRKVEEFCPESASSEEWDVRGLMRWLSELTGSKELPEVSDDADQGEVMETVDKFVDACFAAKAERIGEKPCTCSPPRSCSASSIRAGVLPAGDGLPQDRYRPALALARGTAG